jgi:prepilin-type N-terminal cleavage/methylation domain-containing protein
MRTSMRKTTDQRGFSFLEVIVALAVMGVVTTAVFHLYVTQHKNYLNQEDVSIVQQNARCSIDEITRNVRMAGHGLPDGLTAIVAANADPDTITVIYSASGCNTYLSEDMPLPSAELKCGGDVSCFSDSQWVYIYEPDSGIGEWFEITEVQTAAFRLQHNTMTLSRKYGANSMVLALDMVKYYVDYTSRPEHPNLMVQRIGEAAQVFAEDIIDLQFRYRMKNGMVVHEPLYSGNIREVIISITGGAIDADDDKEEPLPHNKRTFSSSVFLRNNGV